jgi:hypothetical protein
MEEERDFILKCRVCQRVRRARGVIGNPPKVYHCGREMVVSASHMHIKYGPDWRDDVGLLF